MSHFFRHKLRPLIRHLSERFGLQRFHRFEVAIMRVLFAVVIFQSLPLGAPWSSWTQVQLEKIAPGKLSGILADEDKNQMLRPPLLPISQMLPNSEAKLNYHEQEKANGLAHLFDLTFFSDERFVKALPWIVLPCLLLYMSGIGLPVALPILLIVQIGARTLYNSQGYIHHGFQMVSLVLMVQTGVVLWHCFKNWREAFGIRRAKAAPGSFTFWDSLVRYSQYMIIGCYVIAGVIKPINSDGEWFKNSHLIGIQLVKTDRQNYYSDLSPDFGKDPVPYASEMFEHPNLTRLFMGCGVLLEIFAFLALYNRLTAFVMGLMFILFHYFNEFLMHLYFFNNEKLVWIFLINIPFWIWWLCTIRRKGQDLVPVGEVVVEGAG